MIYYRKRNNAERTSEKLTFQTYNASIGSLGIRSLLTHFILVSTQRLGFIFSDSTIS